MLTDIPLLTRRRTAADRPVHDEPPAASTAGLVNAFTVDVEDYFHVQAFAGSVDPRRWDDYPARVVANTRRVLRLLDEFGVRGTFFILGWVADQYPHLVREIHEAGHEIGCHSFWHRLIYRMTPEEFREDLLQATKAIEEITGVPVTAYRAPSFSVTEDSLWSLDILIEEGYRTDSSIFPVHHDHYGIPHAERFPHAIERGGGTLHEFPPTVHRLGKFNLPMAGGGYFRLYPWRLTRRCLAAVNRRHGRPFVFYIHPWELDPEQPRLPGSWKSRFRHYQNLRTTEPKLRRLLGSFRFGTVSEALGVEGRERRRPAPPDTNDNGQWTTDNKQRTTDHLP